MDNNLLLILLKTKLKQNIFNTLICIKLEE